MSSPFPSNSLQVAIIMGSDSDLSVMQEAAAVLDLFHIGYEITVVSAHRTPERMFTYAMEAAGRGIKIIIAGAGGAAHLPGMVAALSVLPVIGVPVKSSNMNGLDSLYSIVQMPPGVPVATMAINGAKNAGLLAVQILSLADKSLQEKYLSYKEEMKTTVDKKANLLLEKGWKDYLAG